MERIDTLIRAGNLTSAVLADLFDTGVVKPRTDPPKGIENAALGFAEFWSAWPANDRKVAKQKCLDRWAKLGCAADWQRIVAHVEHMKKQQAWQKDEGSFVPMVFTYLTQERWAEWYPPVVTRPAGPTALEKIRADDKITKPPSAETREKIAAMLAAAKGKRA